MNVELSPHSQLASACRASCPAGGNCADCPIARMCVRFASDDPRLPLAEYALAWAKGHPGVRVEAYEPSWDAVDALRDRAAGADLDDRVIARHADALLFA